MKDLTKEELAEIHSRLQTATRLLVECLHIMAQTTATITQDSSIVEEEQKARTMRDPKVSSKGGSDFIPRTMRSPKREG